jgi:hypothetical protein
VLNTDSVALSNNFQKNRPGINIEIPGVKDGKDRRFSLFAKKSQP